MVRNLSVYHRICINESIYGRKKQAFAIHESRIRMYMAISHRVVPYACSEKKNQWQSPGKFPVFLPRSLYYYDWEEVFRVRFFLDSSYIHLGKKSNTVISSWILLILILGRKTLCKSLPRFFLQTFQEEKCCVIYFPYFTFVPFGKNMSI